MKRVHFSDQINVKLIERYKRSKNLRESIESITRLLRRDIPYYEDIRYNFMEGPLKDMATKILLHNEVVSLIIFKSKNGFDSIKARDFFTILETSFNKYNSTIIIESDKNMIIFNDNSEREPIIMDSEFTFYNI